MDKYDIFIAMKHYKAFFFNFSVTWTYQPLAKKKKCVNNILNF